MEKYRKFADPKTGKHPYLPQESNQQLSELITGAVLLIPRLFIYIWIQLIILLKSYMMTSNNLLSSKIEQILYKIMFMLMGYKITEKNAKENTADINNCIFLSNFSSHFDPLIIKSW